MAFRGSPRHPCFDATAISALHPQTLGELMEKLYAYMTPLYQPPSI